MASMQTGSASTLHHDLVPKSTLETAPATHSDISKALVPKLASTQCRSNSSLHLGTIIPVQQGSNELHHQQSKLQRLEQQHYVKQQMQQQLVPQQQKQQFTITLQKQSTQVPTHSLPQLHGQHYPARESRSNYQLKKSVFFPVSSPDKLKSSSSQNSQHPSPQTNQQCKLLTQNDGIVPSSASNASPSIPEESGGLSGISTPKDAINVGQQLTSVAPTQVQALNVSSPGKSTSLLPAESVSPDESKVNTSPSLPSNSIMRESPMDLLVRKVH